MKPPLAPKVGNEQTNNEIAKKDEVQDSSINDFSKSPGNSKPEAEVNPSKSELSYDEESRKANTTEEDTTKKEPVTASSWQSHAEKSFLDFVLRSNALIASLAKLHSKNSENNDGSSFSDTECVDSTKEELTLLEQKYKKSIEATKGVFDARKDNLQRSMVEKEAQHLFTLEKLEKDMAEYEKRLKLAEVQKQKKIEQIELEWKRQREMLTEKKPKKIERET